MRMIIWENINALVLSHQQHGQKQQEKTKTNKQTCLGKKVKKSQIRPKITKK